ncbi:Alpha/beta knot methyltransferase [Cokeromyces recurvatus]|uniref:Alpha/beta knot methyltransferase n=1 Tax=Cokeromyces recurvatus TaxID=90255 RepID=UPI00221F6142|nr:Alpha/beta knot methyltransferase [Cokeromyces recurvatus]KAI7902096.1 Alpha/beta knot methyltransferase [Cokeromyces recurvatus]
MDASTKKITAQEDSSWHEAPTQGQPVEPQSRKVIVVLENASLEAARLTSFRYDCKMQLLNCDEHQSILKKLGRDIADARPDIVHQCLLTLLDSPLNKSGHLEVYIHTAKGVVIRINPACRIPRTIKRFSGLMVQLLERGSISGDIEGQMKLLEIIPPPITQYLPENARKIALSWNAPKVRLYKFFKEIPDGQPIVVAVGAMAKGPDTFADAYVDEKIGISNYALSAAVACGKVCCTFEDLWDIM